MPPEHIGRHIVITALWVLVIFLLLLYQFPADRRFTLFFINKTAAQTAVVLVGLSFLLGPLCKIFHFLSHHLRYRKYFGLAGFAAIIVHVILSLAQYNDRFPLAWYREHALGIAFAITAVVIFLILAITSTNRSIHWLGGNQWKMVQRTGYIGLLYTLIHMYVVANSRWQQWMEGKVDMPTSVLIFAFGVLVIVARLIALVIDYLKPHEVTPPSQPVV